MIPTAQLLCKKEYIYNDVLIYEEGKFYSFEKYVIEFELAHDNHLVKKTNNHYCAYLPSGGNFYYDFVHIDYFYTEKETRQIKIKMILSI